MSITITQLLLILGLAQGFIILALFVFSPYFKSRANNFLAATIACITLLGFLDTLGRRNPSSDSFLFLNSLMWEYLVPATLYGYYSRLLTDEDIRPPLNWRLYLPFLVTLGVNLFIEGANIFQFYRLPFSTDNDWLAIYYFVEEVGTLVFCLIVMVLIYRMIVKSDAKQITRKWAKDSFVLFIGGWLIWGTAWLGSQYVEEDLSLLIWVVVMIIYSTLLYRGVFQFTLAEERFEIKSRIPNAGKKPESLAVQYVSEDLATTDSVKSTLPRPDTKLLTDPNVSSIDAVAPKDNRPPPAPIRENTTLARSTTDQYLSELDRLMNDEKLYRSATLSRTEVADLLNISPGYLSRKLSNHPAGNFTDYINGYRVNEVCMMLREPAFANYSLIAIGLEAGFNSRSAFYRVFKASTGRTPAQYKAQTTAEGSNAAHGAGGAGKI